MLKDVRIAMYDENIYSINVDSVPRWNRGASIAGKERERIPLRLSKDIIKKYSAESYKVVNEDDSNVISFIK